MNFTVFVIDDDEAVRDALTCLLRAEGYMARAFASAMAFLGQLQPDARGCVVSDLAMPGMDGIALVERLKELDCRMPVVMITGYGDVPRAVRAMKAGVTDFIEKPLVGDAILDAVRRCLELCIDGVAREGRRSVIDTRLSALTPRERQVLDAVADGCSNKEIAARLAISPRTVEIHRANVMAKMKAESVSDLVRMMLTRDAA